MKTDLFQSCGHWWVFQICWHIECSTFTASSCRIWHSSTGIPSPLLALFVVMLPKAHYEIQLSFWAFFFFLSHILYCYCKPLPLSWAFVVLWSFIFLLKNFKIYYYFSTFIPLFAFPTVLFPLQLIYNVYINLLHLPQFDFAYLLFLSFRLNIFVSFIFIVLFPNWHLTLVLFSSLCFS